MIDWRDRFGASDFANPDPYERQTVGLAHFAIGAILFPALIMVFDSLIVAALVHSAIYICKELAFDLRRIIGRSQTKWGNADILIIMDSCVDFLFWNLGGVFSVSLYGGSLKFAFHTGLGAVSASFAYYIGRKGF